MKTHLEIERRFLVKNLPAGWRHRPHVRIDQGYFPVTSKDIEIRLRRKQTSSCLTVKGGHGRTRLEEEVKLAREQFNSLWPLTRAARVSKTRYLIPNRANTIEMDVYRGAHKGLVTAEIEFRSRHESAAFVPPGWFGREITGEERFANRTLARSNLSRRRQGKTKTAWHRGSLLSP